VSPSGILTLDFEQKVTYVNPAASRLLDRPPAEIAGRLLSDFDAPLATEVAALDAGETHVVPLWGGRRVRVHRGAFLDRGFQRTFVLFEELTEELRQAEKAAYEKLIRMLSHEVNNSVAASNSLLHSCLNYGRSLPADEREDFEAALGIVIARTEQLNRFMRSFADVVRLPPPARQPVDLVELVRGIGRLLRADTDERRILVQWDVQNGLGPVHVDRTQMEQALVNVFRNAIDAIGRDGTITVRVGRRGARPAVVIEDTGPGIPSDVRPHLFTPLFSTKEQGQGIGLTLVQEILSQHQIEYSLDSQPGEPTRFTMLF
jgi:two-component system nitrogen regulation sensor histidine kinase NtrY